MSKPKFKVGDTVYGKPVLAVWPGQVVKVISAKKTERKIPGYIVAIAEWGQCARYKDEVYTTEEEACEANY